MSSLGYLFAAFAVIWVLLFGYILVLNGRQKRLEREIARLQAEKKQ